MPPPTQPPMPTPMQMVCLHCRQGTSDKFYAVWIEHHQDGGHVMAGYGRYAAEKAIIVHHSGPHLGATQARLSAQDLIRTKERKGYRDVLSPLYNSTTMVPPANVFRLMCLKVMPTHGRLIDVNTGYPVDNGRPPALPDPDQLRLDVLAAITTARGGDTAKREPAQAKSKPKPTPISIHVTRSGRSLE